MDLWKFSFGYFSFLRELAKSFAERGEGRRGIGPMRREEFEIVISESGGENGSGKYSKLLDHIKGST